MLYMCVHACVCACTCIVKENSGEWSYTDDGFQTTAMGGESECSTPEGKDRLCKQWVWAATTARSCTSALVVGRMI